MSAADIDGWRGKETIAPLFMSGNTALQEQLRRHLILPYLYEQFLPEYTGEYAGGKSIVFLKPSGVGIRPLLCGSAWRRAFAACAAHSIAEAAEKHFTQLSPNFMQFAGGTKDGTILLANLVRSWYDQAVLDSPPTLAAVSLAWAESLPTFIEIDLKNAFNSACRQAAFDALSGVATKDYIGAGVRSGEALPTLQALQNFFGYFRNMHDTAAILRFFDNCGKVHHIFGTQGGQQGDPLEMLRFCLTIHALWCGVMRRFPSARAAAYADDGFMHADLLTVLRLLSALQHAFKVDLGMELTLHKCKVLIPGLSQDAANHAIRSVISSYPELHSLSDMVNDTALARFKVGNRAMTVEDVVKVDGLVCVGVPIGTPTFVEDWASANIKDLITDLRKLRVMSDPLIHYHLVRFCGLTRPGYMCRTLPPDILQSSRVGLEDFDLAVAAEIFTKAIGDRWRSWPPGTLAWHRTTLQLPHHKGGLGLTPVCASGIAAFYSATARSVRWFSGLSNPTFWISDDLTRPDDWQSSSMCALRDIHQRLLRDYHCVIADPPAQGHPTNAPHGPAAPDGSASRLQLPQLSSLSSGSADDNADSSSRLLPQRRVTQQILTHWLPHNLAPPSDRHALLRRLHQKQEVEAAPNAEEDDLRHFILCAGMARDSSQPRTLHWSPAAWLSCLSNVDGVMAFTTGEWESWFCMFLGLPLPSMCALTANNRRCPCQRPYDVNGDHILTCVHHKATRTRCHNHILACIVSLFQQAGFLADTKNVPRIQRPQDKYFVADMFSRTNGTLRHQDLDLALYQRAQVKVDKYREGYAAPGLRHAFLPAVVSTSGRIHGWHGLRC